MVDLIPFNFIPLEEEKRTVKPVNPFGKQQLYEGRLVCTLEVKTPLFIPNTTGDAYFLRDEHKIREFYSYETLERKPDKNDPPPKHPVIPGSSIRGVLRSVYEAASNSCMSTLRDNYVLSMRQPYIHMPGILRERDGHYTITKAKRDRTVKAVMANGRRALKNPDTGEYFYTGDVVRYKMTPDNQFVDMRSLQIEVDESAELPDDEMRGVVMAGEDFSKKKYDYIFREDSDGGKVEVSAEDIADFLKVLDLYADSKVNKARRHTGYKGYGGNSLSMARNTAGMPVYYRELNMNSGRYYITPAQISRNVFRHRISQIADEMGHYAPCTGKATEEDGVQKHDLCPACNLFGMVGDDFNARSYGGRVRVTDAYPEDLAKIQFGRFRMIAPLMTPSLSSMEFYTDQPYPDSRGWTYDYDAPDKYTLRPLGKGKPALKGRKFYWHHIPSERDYNPPANQDIRFCQTIRPVTKGKFRFQVYFDGVTKKELQQLVAVIRLDGEKYAHKMGAAKPLGYGSVIMKVDQVLVRTLTLNADGILYEEKDGMDLVRNVTLDVAFMVQNVVPKLQSLKEMLEWNVSSHASVAVQYLPLEWYKTNRMGAGEMVFYKPDIVPDISIATYRIRQEINASQPEEPEEDTSNKEDLSGEVTPEAWAKLLARNRKR